MAHFRYGDKHVYEPSRDLWRYYSTDDNSERSLASHVESLVATLSDDDANGSPRLHALRDALLAARAFFESYSRYSDQYETREGRQHLIWVHDALATIKDDFDRALYSVVSYVPAKARITSG